MVPQLLGRIATKFGTALSRRSRSIAFTISASAIVLHVNPRIFPMTQGPLELPKLTGSATVYHVTEGGTVTASNPAFGRVALDAKAYAVRVLGSVEWFDDALVEPRQLLTDDIRHQLALKFDADCLEGVSTSTKPITGLRHNRGP